MHKTFKIPYAIGTDSFDRWLDTKFTEGYELVTIFQYVQWDNNVYCIFKKIEGNKEKL